METKPKCSEPKCKLVAVTINGEGKLICAKHHRQRIEALRSKGA